MAFLCGLFLFNWYVSIFLGTFFLWGVSGREHPAQAGLVVHHHASEEKILHLLAAFLSFYSICPSWVTWIVFHTQRKTPEGKHFELLGSFSQDVPPASDYWLTGCTINDNLCCFSVVNKSLLECNLPACWPACPITQHPQSSHATFSVLLNSATAPFIWDLRSKYILN